jgi:hypothetical protein
VLEVVRLFAALPFGRALLVVVEATGPADKKVD